MKVIVMGSGTSHGIPVIGCKCAVCRSDDSLDRRLRSSLYIEGGGAAAVIDTGQEFRLQAIRTGITRLDAVFLTHAHADHIHGLDDLRPLSAEFPIPIYGNRPAINELRACFAYIFRDGQRGGGKPNIIPTVVDTPVSAGNLRFTPIPLKHGTLDTLGWRIDEDTARCPSAAYLTDVSAIPEESLRLVRHPQPPDILIIDGLRQRLHETHFSFEQALNAALEIQAQRIFLTHICHDFSHREIQVYCRDFLAERSITGVSMEPAFDGLELNL